MVHSLDWALQKNAVREYGWIGARLCCVVLCVCVVVVGDGDDLFVYKVRQQNTCNVHASMEFYNNYYVWL